MIPFATFLKPSEAARRLGVSAKALRLYEQRGLVAPSRTAAGWRAYGPDDMARVKKIVALRALGLTLSAVRRVLEGDPEELEPALAAHQVILEGRSRALVATIERVRELRTALATNRSPADEVRVAFELPWPWGGEHFEFSDVRPLNYLVGPLGSGKTRLAQCIAKTLTGAAFLGLDRLADGGAAAQARLDADPALKSAIDQTLAWLADEGASSSPALVALLVGLEAKGASAVVVDMVEQGLDQATQQAVIAHLRRRGPGARPLFLLTRSSAILELTAVGENEAILYCSANHSPPRRVAPYPGASGYEAVATCLASPEVRARTEGVIAWRPDVAGAPAS